jgi:hypothetical protein
MVMDIKKNKAIEIIRLLEVKRSELIRNEKAKAAYWNGDDCGSISGSRDAKEWLNNSLAAYLTELLNESSAYIPQEVNITL